MVMKIAMALIMIIIKTMIILLKAIFVDLVSKRK